MKYLVLTILSCCIFCNSSYADTIHVVRKNESLWKIARRYYGKGTRWPDLHAANIDKVKNPNHIRPGQRLRIPDSRAVPYGYRYWKTIRAKVVAYEPSRRCCGKLADGRTSTGTSAWRNNGCAVDPKLIPYGTIVSIPGVGLRIADDTGKAMRKSGRRGIYHIDVRMSYYWQARKFGVRYLRVKLYRRI